MIKYFMNSIIKYSYLEIIFGTRNKYRFRCSSIRMWQFARAFGGFLRGADSNPAIFKLLQKNTT